MNLVFLNPQKLTVSSATLPGTAREAGNFELFRRRKLSVYYHRIGQNTERGRDEIGSVSALSAGAYTATLYGMVTRMKGSGCAPPPSVARADFSIMMECTPDIGNVHSVFR
jgi:hypothetical protein